MENEKLKDLILRSFQEARFARISGQTQQDLHRKRSQEWVKILARNFRKCYSNPDNKVKVFSKDFGEHRAEFKVNELLYETLLSVEQAKRRLPKRGHA